MTECPYCGQRVRKRAPKIDRGGPERGAQAEAPSRRACPGCGPGEIEGIAPDTRPYATFGLIVVSLVATLVWAAAPLDARRDRRGDRARLRGAVALVHRAVRAREQPRLPVRRAGGGRGLREHDRAPLRLVPGGRGVPGRRRGRLRPGDRAGRARAVRGRPSGGARRQRRRPGPAVRLARRRPAGGPARRGARQRPDRRWRLRGGARSCSRWPSRTPTSRRPWAAPRRARCSASRSRCSRGARVRAP